MKFRADSGPVVQRIGKQLEEKKKWFATQLILLNIRDIVTFASGSHCTPVDSAKKKGLQVIIWEIHDTFTFAAGSHCTPLHPATKKNCLRQNYLATLACFAQTTECFAFFCKGASMYPRAPCNINNGARTVKVLYTFCRGLTSPHHVWVAPGRWGSVARLATNCQSRSSWVRRRLAFGWSCGHSETTGNKRVQNVGTHVLATLQCCSTSATCMKTLLVPGHKMRLHVYPHYTVVQHRRQQGTTGCKMQVHCEIPRIRYSYRCLPSACPLIVASLLANDVLLGPLRGVGGLVLWASVQWALRGAFLEGGRSHCHVYDVVQQLWRGCDLPRVRGTGWGPRVWYPGI